MTWPYFSATASGGGSSDSGSSAAQLANCHSISTKATVIQAA